MSNYAQKAPFNDWWYWSDVLSKRLRTVSDIYREFDERERAMETGEVAQKLSAMFGAVAQKGARAKNADAQAKYELAQEEEKTIFEGIGIWRDMLSSLPFISQAMEGFLGVEWCAIDPVKEQPAQDGDGKGSAGKAGGGQAAKPAKTMQRAIELFWGTQGRYDEGIRSGLPEDGGLPGILVNMLAAEKGSSNRAPSEYKAEQAHSQYYGRGGPKGPGAGPGGM